MTIDITKIKEGDVVTLRGTVVDILGTEINILFDEGAGTTLIDAKELAAPSATHEPRPLAVGDRARFIGSPKGTGEVKGISGDKAWFLQDGAGCPYTEKLSDLERIP